MNAQDTLRRMAQANPVPDAGHLHADPADAERLFSSIERRRDEMIGAQTRPTPSPAPPPLRPWYRRPAVVFLIAIAAVMVVAVPLVLFDGDGSEFTETPATTAPPEESTTLPLPTAPATSPIETPGTRTLQIRSVGNPALFEATGDLAVDAGQYSVSFTREGPVGPNAPWIAVIGLAPGTAFEDFVAHIAGGDMTLEYLETFQDPRGRAQHPDWDWPPWLILGDIIDPWDTTETRGYDLIPGSYTFLGIPRPSDPVTLATSVSNAQVAAEVTVTTLPSSIAPPSDTPLAWQAIDLDPDQFIENESQIWAVAHAGSRLVAVGRGTSDCAQVWVSPDGDAWNGASAAGGGLEAPCGAVIQDVASNGEVFVAVGREGAEAFGLGGTPTVWASADGLSWDHVVPSGMPFAEGDEILTVAGSETGFVAAGSDIWFSPDGRTWSRATAPPVETIVDVAASPGGFFGVGYLPGTVAIFDQQWASANAVLHSPDGQAWRVVAELEGTFQEGTACWTAGNAVTYGPGGYVIAGDCVPEEADIAHSSLWMSEDGLSWSQVPYDHAAFGEPAYIQSISADDSGYFAGGWSLGAANDRATVWISDDGVSWIRMGLADPVAAGSGIYSVAVHDGTVLAVGQSGSEPAIWRGTRP